MNRRGRHARVPLLIAVLFLLALIPFALYRGSQVPEAEAAWWNPSWQYRQSIHVTNNTTEQTNVYISVTLVTSDTSKFQADCGDLRFTKQNGQLLPYYIVSGCGAASTSVHVQLDTFPAGAQTFYAYYGNPSADNGFSSADFLMAASSYTVGGVGGEETGPGPVAYWKFDEGSGSTAFDSANYGTGDELLTDGNMEAADTSAWKVAGTISKISSNPAQGSRALRVENNTGAATNVWAYQEVVEPGKQYRVTGWMRSNGVHNPTLYFITPAVVGTSSTNWQRIDAVVTTSANRILFGAIAIADSGYVEFDELSIREVVSGNHGTISGATRKEEDQCISGKCLSFDGNDYTTVPDHSSLEPTSAITLSVWVYPTNPTYSYQMIIDKQPSGGAGAGYTLRLDNATGKIKFRAVGTSGNDILGNTTLSANTWYHVVGVYDGSNFKLFINGQEDASKPSTGNITYDASDLQIGRRVDGWNFQGRIDEPKIFPYALTEDQIKAEYNLGAATIMGTGPTVAPPAGGTLSDSLVAHWAFDEQYGQTAHDMVGDNHGTFGADTNPGSDDPTWKPANECKVNGCVEFDGGDYVDRVDTVALSITSSLTLSAWVNSGDTNATRVIIAKDANTTNQSFYLALEGGKVRTLVSSNGSTQIHRTSNTVIPTGSWHHVAGVYNAATQTIDVYLDGRLDNGALSGTVPSSIHDGNAATRIGHDQRLNRFFIGSIDEVKIYNTALTPEQILQDMNAGASVAYSVGSEEADELIDGAGAAPIAEWKFDEKQGTVAYDSSGNGNDGTVNGATWKSGCQQGACLEFDGNMFVRTPIETDSLSLPVTFSAWFYPSSSTHDTQAIISGYKAGQANRWDVVFNRSLNGKVGWLYHGIPGSIYSNNQLELNRWHHVTVVHAGQTISLYVNGQFQGSSTTAGALGTSEFVHIGNWPIGSQSFRGQIDHVRIYDYARTPAQIAYDYNRGAPVAHWKFDECEGTVAHDSSGNDNHGAINIGASGSQTTVGTCQTAGAWANGKDGKFSGSLNFDGNDDKLVFPDSSSLNSLTERLTLSVWTKEQGGWSTLLHGNNDGEGWQKSYWLAIGSNTITCVLNGTSVSRSDATVNLDGNWKHVACTYDGSTARVYLNGRKVHSWQTTGNINYVSGLTIGSTSNSIYPLSRV